MSGKCTNCNKEYHQFMATSTPHDDGTYTTKRYYRCPECQTVYIETDKNGETTVTRQSRPVTLDDWVKT